MPCRRTNSQPAVKNSHTALGHKCQSVTTGERSMNCRRIRFIIAQRRNTLASRSMREMEGELASSVVLSELGTLGHAATQSAVTEAGVKQGQSEEKPEVGGREAGCFPRGAPGIYLSNHVVEEVVVAQARFLPLAAARETTLHVRSHKVLSQDGMIQCIHAVLAYDAVVEPLQFHLGSRPLRRCLCTDCRWGESTAMASNRLRVSSSSPSAQHSCSSTWAILTYHFNTDTHLSQLTERR